MMKASVPSKEFLASISYDPATGVFTRLKAGKRHLVGKPITRTNGKPGYIRISAGKEWYYGHRLAWFLVHGRWPEPTADHRNNVRTDNRIANLREASISQNAANRSRGTQRFMRGVTLDRKPRTRPFLAQIKIDGQHINLGRFHTEDEAHSAYRVAALDAFGEFARFE